MCNIWIEEIAKKIFSSQSFRYNSFEDAKNKIVDKKQDRYILYDRITLSIYDHNLRTEEYSHFCECIKSMDSFKGHNDIKLREEYRTLLHFFIVYNKDLLKEKIEKKERPDFVLETESKRIGFEITKLLLNNEGLIHSIVKDLNSNKTTIEKSKDYVQEKYGRKAKGFEYLQTGNAFGIGPKEAINLTAERKQFALQIVNKYNKYKEESKNYEKLIIVCDVIEGFSITESWEADEVLDEIKCDGAKGTIYVYILYKTQNNGLEYRKKLLS